MCVVPPSGKSDRSWALVGVLAIYVALAVTYGFSSPLYEPVDEIRHFRYVRHIIAYRSLPIQSAEGRRAQSHHPPLYYALGALISWWVPVEQGPYYEPPVNPHWGYRYWEVSNDNKNQYVHRDDERMPFRGVALAVYLVRGLTVLMGGCAVWLTYRMGRLVLGGSPLMAVGAASLLAFNPQFLHLSGAINNDVPATLVSAAVLLVCLSTMRRGPNPRTDVTLGVLAGLALLTKFNLVALFGPIGLAYILGAPAKEGSRCDWRAAVRGMLIVIGAAALISGWWFWRNQVLYGDLTGMSKVTELWSGRDPAESLWALRQGLPYLWSSLWGRFGYGQVPLHEPVYQAILAFCGLALVGHLLPRRRRGRASESLFLVAVCLTFLGVVAYYILIQPAGAMGRFLFPALPAFGLLLAMGVRRFLPARVEWVAGLAATLVMAALSLYGLVAVLHPAFARPRALTESQIARVPNPVQVELGGVATLLGYSVSPASVKPGDSLAVTLYWRADARTEQDHSVFVHLLSDVGTIIAQRDTYPGLGRYPTTAWQAGRAFADTYRVHIPDTAYTPDTGYVQVGMYLPGGPRLVAADGRDAIRLAEVNVAPHPADVPNPLQANFDGRVALIGYALDQRVARPGDTVRLTLYWRALAEMATDYAVFAHVLGNENQIWARSDGWPSEGRAPTSGWEPGEVIEDVRELTFDAATPPYLYQIEVGLYEPGAAPLPVVADDGHWLDQRVLLSQIRVAAE